MSGPEDLDFDEIFGQEIPVWEASGDTYHLRAGFVSWGWNWVSAKKVWQIQAEPDDPCLRWGQRQPGVIVRQL